MSVCLPTCLFAYLSVCLSVCLPIFLSAYLLVCLAACLSAYLVVCIFVCLHICLSVICLYPLSSLPICLPAYPYLSACMALSLSLLCLCTSGCLCSLTCLINVSHTVHHFLFLADSLFSQPHARSSVPKSGKHWSISRKRQTIISKRLLPIISNINGTYRDSFVPPAYRCHGPSLSSGLTSPSQSPRQQMHKAFILNVSDSHITQNVDGQLRRFSDNYG